MANQDQPNKEDTTLKDVVDAIKSLEKSIGRDELDSIDNRLLSIENRQIQWILILFTGVLAIIGATQLSISLTNSVSAVATIDLAFYLVFIFVLAALIYYRGGLKGLNEEYKILVVQRKKKEEELQI